MPRVWTEGGNISIDNWKRLKISLWRPEQIQFATLQNVLL